MGVARRHRWRRPGFMTHCRRRLGAGTLRLGGGGCIAGGLIGGCARASLAVGDLLRRLRSRRARVGWSARTRVSAYGLLKYARSAPSASTARVRPRPASVAPSVQSRRARPRKPRKEPAPARAPAKSPQPVNPLPPPATAPPAAQDTTRVRYQADPDPDSPTPPTRRWPGVCRRPAASRRAAAVPLMSRPRRPRHGRTHGQRHGQRHTQRHTQTPMGRPF